MSAEKPVSLRRRKKLRQSRNKRCCVIHDINLHNYGEVHAFSDITWTQILECKVFRLNSEVSKTKLTDFCEQVPETLNVGTCHGYHRSCYATSHKP